VGAHVAELAQAERDGVEGHQVAVLDLHRVEILVHQLREQQQRPVSSSRARAVVCG